MPGRLLMAAEILLDVARTVNAADRPLLEAAAAELTERATEICGKRVLPHGVGTNVEAMRSSFFRQSDGLDRQVSQTTSNQ